MQALFVEACVAATKQQSVCFGAAYPTPQSDIRTEKRQPLPLEVREGSLEPSQPRIHKPCIPKLEPQGHRGLQGLVDSRVVRRGEVEQVEGSEAGRRALGIFIRLCLVFR